MDPDHVPIRRLDEPKPEPERPDTLAKWRQYEHDPDLSHWATELIEAHQLVARGHKHALEYAVKAGGLINAVRRCLSKHVSLMPWKIFRQMFVQEISLRTTNNYLACFVQVNMDSNICYPSISACLIAYAKAHPRCRLKVRSKEAIDEAPQPEPGAEMAAAIAEDKSYLRSSFAEWLADPPMHEVVEHVRRHGYTVPSHHRPQVRAYLGSVARLLLWLESAEISAREQSWLVEYCRRLVRVLHELNLRP